MTGSAGKAVAAVALAWALATAAEAQTARDAITPAGDHHTHLLGPYALPLPDPLPPEITLAPELANLLAARAALNGDVRGPQDLEPVFTSDARLLNAYIAPTVWLDEPGWFARYLSLGFKDRSRYVPTLAHVDGDSGHIVGTVLDTPSGVHAQNFLLVVRKGDDGRWRIAAESTTAKTPPRYHAPLESAGLIEDMDRAGIAKALVLSEAFWIGYGDNTPRRLRMAPDEASAVRAENDWAAAEVARHPDRLVLACSANPLADYAVAELERCATTLKARAFKMNFSQLVDFDNADHLAKASRFFARANALGVALVVHLEPGHAYGPREAGIFLDRIASAAPDVAIQIAHMAGNGPGVTSPDALRFFAEARQAGDPRTANLYFDLGGIVYASMPEAAKAQLVERMRQIGLDHVLYASDYLPGDAAGNPRTSAQWTWVRTLPLTDAELADLADNRPDYMR